MQRPSKLLGSLRSDTFAAEVNQVVPAPKGATVRYLPDGKEKVENDGNTVFTFNGVTYEPMLVDGAIAYKVIYTSS